jgi:hypothetical protein
MTASIERIEERCNFLQEEGYIAPFYEGTDQYELTTQGQLYLNGAAYGSGVSDELR